MNDDPGALPAETSLSDGPGTVGPGSAETGPGSAETRPGSAAAGPPGTRGILFVAWRDLANRRAGGSEVLVDQLAAEPALRSYHLLPSVRGDLLRKLGRDAEARAEFERAAALTSNERERELSAQRAQAADSA